MFRYALLTFTSYSLHEGEADAIISQPHIQSDWRELLYSALRNCSSSYFRLSAILLTMGDILLSLVQSTNLF